MTTLINQAMIPVSLERINIADVHAAKQSGLVISVRADARTTVSELYDLLKASVLHRDGWPEGLSVTEMESAIEDLLVGMPKDHKPFPELSPDNSPGNGYVVRAHPTIDRMYLVINPTIDILSSWETCDEAYCAVWDHAIANGDANAEDFRFSAHYRVTVPVPDGYMVCRSVPPTPESTPQDYRTVGWYFENDEMGSEDFPSEVDARIAAWRHKFAEESVEKARGAEEPALHDGEPLAGVQVHVTQVELDTVLAALRLYQATPRDQLPADILDIASENSVSPLHLEVVDELCERLNDGAVKPEADLRSRYLANRGVICPVCESAAIEADSYNCGDDVVRQGVSCHECGSEWEDHFTLTNLTLTHRAVPEKPAAS